MTTRYLICGGRDFNDKALMEKALASLILHPEDAVVIHGAARGADLMAADWAFQRGVPTEAYPITSADWDRYGRGAGAIRNQQMLHEGKPDVVIAFKGGNGTRDMVRRARAAKVVTITVHGVEGDWFGEATA
jgi:hypothetical protein